MALLLRARVGAACCLARPFSTANNNTAPSQIQRVENKATLYLRLSRPEVHNAFNETLIAEIGETFSSIRQGQYRCVVLTGEGASFSAGADLNWMKKMAKYTREQNQQDALRLFDMFAAIRNCPVPTVARVNGAALGGGSGLVAACDFAFATKAAVFGFTEVKLGLVPAVISRFVMDKLGKGNCSRFFLTGERFNAETALRIGLLQGVSESLEDLDKQIEKIAEELSQNSPQAMTSSKQLIDTVSTLSIAHSRQVCAGVIADARVSADGQEGLSAFLEKRKPVFRSGN